MHELERGSILALQTVRRMDMATGQHRVWTPPIVDHLMGFNGNNVAVVLI